MTEQEWVEGMDIGAMAAQEAFIRACFMVEYAHKSMISVRKFGLFECACCRRAWDQLPFDQSRAAVVVAEKFADGLATKAELARAHGEAMGCWFIDMDLYQENRNAYSRSFDKYAALPDRLRALAMAAANTATVGDSRKGIVYFAMVGESVSVNAEDRERTVEAQTALLTDIFGNPFRPVVINPAWPMLNGGTVGRMTQMIYDERSFELLPILADALEDAGCDSEEILTHCRSEGLHARGCWVIDALLGKS